MKKLLRFKDIWGWKWNWFWKLKLYSFDLSLTSNHNFRSHKVAYVFPMIIVPTLPHAEFGRSKLLQVTIWKTHPTLICESNLQMVRRLSTSTLLLICLQAALSIWFSVSLISELLIILWCPTCPGSPDSVELLRLTRTEKWGQVKVKIMIYDRLIRQFIG